MSLDVLNTFIDNLVTNGLEHYRVLYGWHRAFVEKNDDPEQRGRIQVSIPPFQKRNSPLNVWIDPAFNVGGPNRGTFWPPDVGDKVWVRFDRGRPDSPVSYVHGWHGEPECPAEFAYAGPKPSGSQFNTPTRRGFITRAGHHLVFDDLPGSEAISLVWHQPDSKDESLTDVTKSSDRSKGAVSSILFRPTGNITIMNKVGQTIDMDADNGSFKILVPKENGSSETAMVVIDDDGIKINDQKGKNLLFIDRGSISAVAEKEITLRGKSFSSETGSQLLGKGASQALVLGNRYTAARKSMHQPVSTAFITAGTALTAAAGAIVNPLVLTEAPKLIAALVTLFGAMAAVFTPAGIAINVFEGAASTYLSKTSKTT